MDDDLLEAWREGDASAGKQLFGRHVDAVASFFGTKILDGAEDLVQDTFLRMLETRDRVRHGGSFRAYALGIARNVLREHIRALARDRDIDPKVDSMAQLAPGPSTVVGDRKEHELLLEGLRHLPIDDQILLELFYWEGLDSGALGEIVDMPASSVRTRLWRARERLKRAMTEIATTPAVLASTIEGLEDWAAKLRAHANRETSG